MSYSSNSSSTHNNEGETSNRIYRLQIKLLKIEYKMRVIINTIEYRSTTHQGRHILVWCMSNTHLYNMSIVCRYRKSKRIVSGKEHYISVLTQLVVIFSHWQSERLSHPSIISLMFYEIVGLVLVLNMYELSTTWH